MIEQDSDDTGTGGTGGGPGTPVAVGLGSNVGDRAAHLATGVGGLRSLLRDVRCSRVWETEPLGVPDDHGPYLNMCCAGRTGLAPGELLARLLEIEEGAGRDRRRTGGGARPRRLDLDLLLYGDAVVDEPGLRVPHPRMRRRAFVLVPLAEVAGSWRDPETGRTVDELAGPVDRSGVEPYRGDLPGELEEVITG